MALQPWQAVALSLGSLAAGWFVYDGLCRSPAGRNPVLLAGLVFALLLAAAYGYVQVFSGRSSLLHVGMLIGTVMAANVFAIIIPNQKKIADALIAGREPDPRLGAIGKQRSVHNTYLTLPVIVFMVSGHYPMLTGHPNAWLLAGLIIVAGAAARYALIRHDAGDPLDTFSWALPLIAIMLIGALWLTQPADRPARAAVDVADAEVMTITQTHCVSCHAERPTNQSFPEPPKGVVIETLDDLRRYHQLVDIQAVKTEAMPLGNETGMTAEERAKLGAWLDAQRR
jgi:uncharacterized membrane protein